MNEKKTLIESIKKALLNLNGRCELKNNVKLSVESHIVEVKKVGYALGSVVVRGTENGREVHYVISEDTTPTNQLNTLFIELSNELLDRGYKSRVRCYSGDSFGESERLFTRDEENKLKAFELFNEICQRVKAGYNVPIMMGQMTSNYTKRRFVVSEVVGDRYYIVDIIAAI